MSIGGTLERGVCHALGAHEGVADVGPVVGLVNSSNRLTEASDGYTREARYVSLHGAVGVGVNRSLHVDHSICWATYMSSNIRHAERKRAPRSLFFVSIPIQRELGITLDRGTGVSAYGSSAGRHSGRSSCSPTSR